MSAGRESRKPLVAVVTPVYNGDPYLEATMKCVQKQTYDRLIHVIVDNCSSDNTAKIIDRYRDRRVKLVCGRNDSVVSVRDNWTKAMCLVPDEVDFVKFLCADDLMRPDCISRLVEVASLDEKIGIVLCHDIFMDRVHRSSLTSNQSVFDGVEVARGMLDDSINWLPYHHLFVRFQSENKESFFLDAPLHFDFAAAVRRSLEGQFGYVHEPLVYTRWHENSLTSQQIGPNALKVLLEKYDILCAFGDRCWDPQAFKFKRDWFRARMMRLALKWTAKGRWDVAREFLVGLRERNAAPRLLDWVGSIQQWGEYVKWKRLWRLPTGPEINEEKFLSDNSI